MQSLGECPANWRTDWSILDHLVHHRNFTHWVFTNQTLATLFNQVPPHVVSRFRETTPTPMGTSGDPMGLAAGDTNVTRYAANNALNELDPTGLLATRLGSSSEGRLTGESVLPSHEMEWVRSGTPGRPIQMPHIVVSIRIRLKAREQRSYHFTLNRMVDLTLSGTYAVVVKRTVSGHPAAPGPAKPGELESNELSLEITEPSTARR
jgi:hypothetical protein